MLEKIRLVLVNPSHPGNIGATARAMKNMGLSSLYLVSPHLFPHQEATVRASGADDILANAVVVDRLSEAIADCHWVFATSARSRTLAWPTCTPKACAEKINQRREESIAIVFGRESSGLTNDELSLCHYHVHIPTNPDFSSLNLAAAVQIITYELRLAATHPVEPSVPDDLPATAEAVAGFMQQLNALLVQIEFLDPKHPKLLITRLKRLFNRAHLEQKEIHILRGILSTIEKRLV